MPPPRLLLKAAKIQLLAAEAIKQPSMIDQKVICYWRATCQFQDLDGQSNIQKNIPQAPLNVQWNGQWNDQLNSLLPNQDIYTVLLKIGGNLSRFLVRVLFDKWEPMRIAAMRGLEFVIE